MFLFGILLLAGAMAQDEVCERQLVLEQGETFNMAFYADVKKVWNTCKWIVSSPANTYMTLSCSYTDLPPADACTNDAVSISTTGDKDIKDDSARCGPSSFDQNSVSNVIVFQLKLAKDAGVGSITCKIRVNDKKST